MTRSKRPRGDKGALMLCSGWSRTGKLRRTPAFFLKPVRLGPSPVRPVQPRSAGWPAWSVRQTRRIGGFVGDLGHPGAMDACEFLEVCLTKHSNLDTQIKNKYRRFFREQSLNIDNLLAFTDDEWIEHVPTLGLRLTMRSLLKAQSTGFLHSYMVYLFI